jgi:phenylpyruvate tautomerase PptA (4-oxalocrotonate tautomerase family)
MPMIDVYAVAGTFADEHRLAADLATAVMTIEQVPDIPMFRQNTAAFIHDLPAGSLSNVDGDDNYVRVQVLTNAGALDRAKQLAVVRELTAIVAAAAADPSLAERTWVLLTQAPDGGWGLSGHANTNDELVGLARAQIAQIRQARLRDVHDRGPRMRASVGYLAPQIIKDRGRYRLRWSETASRLFDGDRDRSRVWSDNRARDQHGRRRLNPESGGTGGHVRRPVQVRRFGHAGGERRVGQR